MMNPHSNVPTSGEELKKGIWRTGKEQTKKFLNIKISKGKEFGSYFLSLLLAALILAPFVLLAYQYFDLYKYSITVIVLFLVFVWIMLMLLSALSNWLNVLIVKAWLPDNQEIQEVKAASIFVYQLFNPGFAAFALIVILVFVFSALS